MKKTTLSINENTLRELKREALRRGQTMSELIDIALRIFITVTPKEEEPLPPLPTIACGGFNVDIADRDALYSVMEEA